MSARLVLLLVLVLVRGWRAGCPVSARCSLFGGGAQDKSCVGIPNFPFQGGYNMATPSNRV